MNKLMDIWTPTTCLSKQQLLDYVQQKIDEEELHVVERHLIDCSLCSDAVDGLLEAPIDIHLAQLTSLTHHKNVFSPQKDETLSSNGKNHSDKKSSLNLYKRWYYAAAILLLIGLGSFSMFHFFESKQKQLAHHTSDTPQSEKQPETDLSQSKQDQEIATTIRLETPHLLMKTAFKK
jgi:hypothetical protein